MSDLIRFRLQSVSKSTRSMIVPSSVRWGDGLLRNKQTWYLLENIQALWRTRRIRRWQGGRVWYVSGLQTRTEATVGVVQDTTRRDKWTNSSETPKSSLMMSGKTSKSLGDNDDYDCYNPVQEHAGSTEELRVNQRGIHGFQMNRWWPFRSWRTSWCKRTSPRHSILSLLFGTWLSSSASCLVSRIHRSTTMRSSWQSVVLADRPWSITTLIPSWCMDVVLRGLQHIWSGRELHSLAGYLPRFFKCV